MIQAKTYLYFIVGLADSSGGILENRYWPIYEGWHGSITICWPVHRIFGGPLYLKDKRIRSNDKGIKRGVTLIRIETETVLP